MPFRVPSNTNAKVVAVLFTYISHEVRCIAESTVARCPVFLPARRIASQGQDVVDAGIFRFLYTPNQFYVFSSQSYHRCVGTLRALSRVSFSMLVQVKCITVSSPYTLWAVVQISSVFSLVEPPAPHVHEINVGSSRAIRPIRSYRFATLYMTVRVRSVH